MARPTSARSRILLSSRRAVGAGLSDRGRHRCGYHGMEFNREGVCTFIPGQTIIPKRAGEVVPGCGEKELRWILMGQADKANPAAVAIIRRMTRHWPGPRYAAI